MNTDDFLSPTDSTVPIQVRSNLRFHLDEDRIRDFLMGENLYGDPALALREAYQNAVDACRLADARRSFLRLPELTAPVRSFDIEFEQGVDADGRAFIDCIDHGAGMGIDELSLAFCQAGVRASDLADRAAEAADFASALPPIELWQNSRFGIGVMSYFMLADAVTVSTARINRDGSIGRLLTIDISGPAEAFDVLDRGQANRHGTRVRLWLKSTVSVSAVSTLRALVFVCPFAMRVRDRQGLEHRWTPHELNRASRLGGSVAQHAVPAVPGRLWWLARGGTVLADGIWADEWLRGMIVNLDGPLAPTLTADRTKIAKADHAAIESLGAAAAAQATERAWHIVGKTHWLTDATIYHHKLADAVVAQAAQRDLAIKLTRGSVPLRTSGYMPCDEDAPGGSTLKAVHRWQFSRLAAAGYYSTLGISAHPGDAVEPARPSDAILLGVVASNRRHGSDLETSHWFARETSLYEAERHLEIPLAAITARARELALPLPGGVDRLPESSPIIRTALSFSRRERRDGSFWPLGLLDIVQTAWHHRVTVHDVCDELELRSIDFDPRARAIGSTPVQPNMLIAASEHVDGIAPWLTLTEPVGLDHVAQVAQATHSSSSEVVRWLRDLGFADLPTFTLDGNEPTADDIRMLSCDLDGMLPFLDSRRPVRRKHLKKAAKRLHSTTQQLSERFERFGVTFSDLVAETGDDPLSQSRLYRMLDLTGHRKSLLRSRHRQLMSRDCDGRAPWLNPAEPVLALTVATQALSLDRSLDEVIADYRWLGYDAEDPRTAPRVRTPGHALAFG